MYIKDKLLKVGGKTLDGMVRKVEISQNATIEDIEDSKGTTKKNQPTGYEPAKITVDMILESTPRKTSKQQLTDINDMFKPSGQKKATVINIVNEECAARKISKVYFKNLTSSKVTEQSKRLVTLEFVQYAPATVTVNKNTLKKSSQKVSPTKTVKDSGVSNDYKNYLNTQRGKAPKIKSKTSHTPAKDNASTSAIKKKIKETVK